MSYDVPHDHDREPAGCLEAAVIGFITVVAFALAVGVVWASMLALTGCVAVTYQTPEGSITYTRVGSTKVDGLEVKRGDTTVKLAGYGSDGAYLIEAAARGAAQGVSP